MITTVHGASRYTASRKAFHALGCSGGGCASDIASQIIDNLGWTWAMVQVLRERHRDRQVPARADTGQRQTGDRYHWPVERSWRGACYRLLDEVLDPKLAGQQCQRAPRCRRILPVFDVTTLSVMTMCPPRMAGCDLRIVVPVGWRWRLSCGRPAFAIGGQAIGLVTEQNLTRPRQQLLATSAPGFQPSTLRRAEGADPFGAGLQSGARPSASTILQGDLQGVVTGLESVYQGRREFETLRREMPSSCITASSSTRAKRECIWHLAPVAMFEKHPS